MLSLDTHILFTAIPAWGHIRPICILLAKLVKENENIVATAIVSPNFLDKAVSEIAAELGQPSNDSIRKRVRVLSTFLGTGSDSLFELMGPTEETYAAAYETLTLGRPISCAITGTIFEPALAPTIVIMDFFALKQFRATRSLTGHRVPIVASIPAHASSMIRLFGPEKYGGMGDPTESVLAEAARTGLSENEIGDKLLKQATGKIIKIAGLPDMYDWEYFAQQLPFEGQWPVTKGANVILKECDDVISVSSYAFESESIESMRSWFAEWRKQLFVLGPLLPESYSSDIQSSRGATDVEEFLETMLLERGEKSVLFMSFGTFFWSTAPEYIEEVLEALIEKDFPFIFTYASPFANLPGELLRKVQSSGVGLLTKWSPQQYILSHPATGWFLSHCGHNSIMESLGCGIPLICWPFQADQPAAAAYLSERLSVAFELIEVRTGEKGTKPLLRNGRAPKGTRAAVGAEIRSVIDDCRGTKGEELRKNAEAFKPKFAEAWKKDGISRKEAQTLLIKYKT